MSKRTMLFLGVLAVVGVASALAVIAHAQAPAREAGWTARPFGDNIVLVTGKSIGATLERVELRNMGGRTFVVGRVSADQTYTRGPVSGALIWLPLDEVNQMVELPAAKMEPGREANKDMEPKK